MKILNDEPMIYLVTDSNGIDNSDFFRIIEDAAAEGVGYVQLREKNLTTLEFYEKALRVKKICGFYNSVFLINDRIDIAQAVDADGVHLGAKDLPIAATRKILGADKIIGATAKTVTAARNAYKDGADYFGIGAFFATDTKTDARLMTPGEVSLVTSSVDAPFVGIGGLNENNLDVLTGTGVKGAAISSAIMRADNVREAVRKIKEQLNSILEV